jgi:hypothetical protein
VFKIAFLALASGTYQELTIVENAEMSYNVQTEMSSYTECKILKKRECTVSVPDSKSRNIPEVVFVRRWAVGVLGIWKGWDSWVKGGANGVSLQAT